MAGLVKFFWAKPTAPKNPLPALDTNTNECAFEDDENDCAIDNSSDLDIPLPAPRFQKMNKVWTLPHQRARGARNTAPINIDFSRQTIDVAQRRRAAKNEPEYAHDATVTAVQEHIDVFGNNEHTQRLYGHLPDISSYKPRYEDKAKRECDQNDGDDEDDKENRPSGRITKDWDHPTDYAKLSEKKRAVRQTVGLIPNGSQQLGDACENHLSTEALAYIRNMLGSGNPKPTPFQVQMVAYRLLRLEEADNVVSRYAVRRTEKEIKKQPQSQNPPLVPVANTAAAVSDQIELQSDDGDKNYVTEPNTPSTNIQTNTSPPVSDTNSATNAQQTGIMYTAPVGSLRYLPASLPKQPTGSLLSQQLATLQNRGGTSLPATNSITQSPENDDADWQPVTILQGLPSPTPKL
jgi:hypothetical protein